MSGENRTCQGEKERNGAVCTRMASRYAVRGEPELDRKYPVVSRMINASLSMTKLARDELELDLAEMGCLGLIWHPWQIRSEQMIAEFIFGAYNQYHGMDRRQRLVWMAEVWAKVYRDPCKGAGFATLSDRFSTGRFKNPADPKEGYAAGDCENPWDHHLLEFLIPILYREKPSRVTSTMANTIFGALGEQNGNPPPRPIHWGIIIQQVIKKVVGGIEGKKTSPVGLFLFHMYWYLDLLSSPEQTTYWKAESTSQVWAEVGLATQREGDG